jgi:hypothetical protein
MSSLPQAAATLLSDVSHEDGREAKIERFTCEVQLGREHELVTVRLSEAGLRAVCTCGRQGCAHAQAALQLVAAGARPPEAGAKYPSNRPPALAQDTRPSAGPLRHDRAAALIEPLTDVVTAVVRAGVCSDHTASVLETLSRVERALPPPLPLGLLRWLGRMREALEMQDVALVSQALRAAATFAEDLRASQRDAAARERSVSWLGAETSEDLMRLSDRSMLEVAREWVAGSVRQQIERRYLLDLDSGEFFREECVRGLGMSSLGSCPRSIGVSLAEVDLGCGPRRLRLLQYTTTPDVERSSWELLAEWGQRDSDALAAAYRSVISQFGALAEPFVLIAPRAVEPGPVPCLTLERGAALPLTADEEPLVLKRFEHICAVQPPLWVAGRLVQRAGQLMLRPLAAATVDGSALRHERL